MFYVRFCVIMASFQEIKKKFFSYKFEYRIGIFILFVCLFTIPILSLDNQTINTPGAYIAISLFIISIILTVGMAIYEKKVLEKKIQKKENGEKKASKPIEA